MANIKIAQLTNKTTIADTDIVIIEDASSTKKMTISNFKKGMNAPITGKTGDWSWIKYPSGVIVVYRSVSFASIVINESVFGSDNLLKKSASVSISPPGIGSDFTYSKTIRELQGYYGILNMSTTTGLDISLGTIGYAKTVTGVMFDIIGYGIWS